MLQARSQIREPPQPLELEPSDHGYDIELDDVHFAYRPDQPVLQALSSLSRANGICPDGIPALLVQLKLRQSSTGTGQRLLYQTGLHVEYIILC